MLSTIKQLLKLASQIKTGYIQPLNGSDRLYLQQEARSEKNALNAKANQLRFVFVGRNDKLSFPPEGLLKVDSDYPTTWLKLLVTVLEKLDTKGAQKLLGALNQYNVQQVVKEVPGVKEITFRPLPVFEGKFIDGNVVLSKVQIGGTTFWKIDQGYAHDHYQIEASFPRELAQNLGADQKVFFPISTADMDLAILENDLFRDILEGAFRE